MSAPSRLSEIEVLQIHDPHIDQFWVIDFWINNPPCLTHESEIFLDINSNFSRVGFSKYTHNKSLLCIASNPLM